MGFTYKYRIVPATIVEKKLSFPPVELLWPLCQKAMG